MKEPCDDIQTVLLIVAEQNNLHGQQMIMTGLGKRRIRTPNYNNAAEMFIKEKVNGLITSHSCGHRVNR